jgi:hypothetical protein
MQYFFYSQKQRDFLSATEGAIKFYDLPSPAFPTPYVPSRRVPFTEQNATGTPTFSDAAIVGKFPDDKAPRSHVLVIDEDRRAIAQRALAPAPDPTRRVGAEIVRNAFGAPGVA